VIALNERPLDDTGSLHSELERIYVETRSSLCSYILYLGAPAEQAQEITQEVFLRLYQTMLKQTRLKGAPIENLRAWLFKVAHNLGLKVRHRERSFRVVSPDWNQFSAPAESSEDLLISRERNSRVAAAMESLSPQQRHCLYLRSEGLRYREIAEVIGISQSSVNEFLRRAISRLAEAAHG
jgi:RNA polymerase sigma-70 factor (ECF subfamily)